MNGRALGVSKGSPTGGSSAIEARVTVIRVYDRRDRCLAVGLCAVALSRRSRPCRSTTATGIHSRSRG